MYLLVLEASFLKIVYLSHVCVFPLDCLYSLLLLLVLEFLELFVVSFVTHTFIVCNQIFH